MPQPLRIALLVLMGLIVLAFAVFIIVRSFKRSQDPARLLFVWFLTLGLGGTLMWAAWKLKDSYAAVALPFLAILIALILTPYWAPAIGRFFASPLTSMLDGGFEEVEPQPMYSIAEAKRKQGKFHEAVFEIHQQLARFPTDFTGQMMLAETQAENMNDLPGAEVTIHRICDQTNHAPRNIAYALSALADWHLKYDQDIDAARAGLEKIVEKFPDTDLAQNAENRIAHLSTSQLLAQSHDRSPIALKHGVEYLGMVKDQTALLPKEKDYQVETEELVKHLDQFPHDTEARERLAVIYAENYGKLHLATEQLEQLISMHTESPRHIVRWLNLLADLQVRCTEDTALAKQTLQRIIDRYPDQSFAELAQQRMMTLSLELHRYKQARVVKFPAGAETVKS